MSTHCDLGSGAWGEESRQKTDLEPSLGISDGWCLQKEALAVRCDVRLKADVDALVQQTVGWAQYLDIFVANAGRHVVSVYVPDMATRIMCQKALMQSIRTYQYVC